MALPVTETTARRLDTLVSTTRDSYVGNPANFVTNGGEKLLSKLAQNNRIFQVNDAERVEHPVMYGSDEAWTLYISDQFDGAPSGSNLGVASSEVLTKVRSTIINKTKNFNVPQAMMNQPVTSGTISTVQALTKRALMETFAQEESLLVLGNNAQTTTSPATLSPFGTDTDAALGTGSMSLLGIFDPGHATPGDTFMGISVTDDSNWKADITAPAGAKSSAASAFATASDGVLMDVIQGHVIDTSRYGGLERPTDVFLTTEFYQYFLKELRAKSQINDGIIANLGTVSAIPFAGVMVDFHHYIVDDDGWDIDGTANTCSPIIGLNLNSLRMNLVYGGQIDPNGSFIKTLSGFTPHPTNTTYFQRWEYRQCYSLDNGRRSFFYDITYTS